MGFDAFVGDNANLRTGVLLHLGTPGHGDSSYLLDMTAATESWFDPALGIGKIFSDRDTGITITPVWADARGVGVGVTFDPAACMRGVPTVSLGPRPEPVAAGWRHGDVHRHGDDHHHRARRWRGRGRRQRHG